MGSQLLLSCRGPHSGLPLSELGCVFTQGGRFNDKDFARWQMGVKQNIFSLKAGLSATLVTGWGQSEGQVKRACEKGGWLAQQHPPQLALCASQTLRGCHRLPGVSSGAAPVQILTGD